MGTIQAKTTEEMVRIVAGLVTEGVVFEVTGTEGNWIIKLTGGH